jgi:ribosomal-protein-alanine N-acetyltransferase
MKENVSIVETARLRGEKLEVRNWKAWQQMGSNAVLMEPFGGVWTEAQAWEKFLWNCHQWDENGHGQWMFFLKDVGALVGRCGIRKLVVNDKHEIELGYAVVPELWGKGFATEMSAKALETAFSIFDYPSVVAFALVTNTKSLRVMEKLGFKYETQIIHAGRPHVLYRVWNPDKPHVR